MAIKAYHQVGTEEWSPDELSGTLDDLISAGKIQPAVERLDRQEMEAECFTAPERGATLKQRFEGASPEVMKALEEIARQKIQELPESGITRSLFNCVDLLAGDLEMIFLKPGDWYSVPNGFVFDAEELLRKGARFRNRDLLGGYSAVIEGASEMKFSSKTAAKRYIERELRDVHTYFESTGREGIENMREALKRPWTPDLKEIVWPGSLSLKMAKEVWRNGHRIGKRL